MTLTYFKRYRMEIRLDRLPAEVDRLAVPANYELLPWSASLMQRHADVKYASFRDEIDAQVFPCLGELDGCRQLMREITGRRDFVAEATWLAVRLSDTAAQPNNARENNARENNARENNARENNARDLIPCGTIQGLLSAPSEGAIQNLGVHPSHRDHGLGGVLLKAALEGFRRVGCRYVHLEVTVQNTAAIRLYERFGFRNVETLYKMADVQYA